MAADAERRAAPRLVIPTGETGAARAEARAALDAIGERLRAPARPSRRLPAGAPVTAPSVRASAGHRRPRRSGALGLEGIVQALHDREAEVDVRGKRLRARVDELRVLVPASVGPAQPAKVRVNVELQPREGSLTELNVIGCNVDEALSRAEKFLDEALMTEAAERPADSRLRHRVSCAAPSPSSCSDHPLVAHFASAPPEQGGGGVTVVELKE